ncbi:MAG: thiol peroxidase [Chloroflexi bacterium]|nr:thiol peroxidase [Chloroflexota bacterium]
MLEERTGVFAAGDNKLTLLGPEIKVGDKAPGFTVSGAGLKQVSLADSAGKVRIIASVPSLDTGVCSEETQKFNELASSLPDDVVILTVSMDLPFAQARWCGAHEVDKVETVSDFKSREFGDSYGVHVKESGLLARAVFVVGKDDIVKHVEYVPLIAQLPDFNAALDAARAASGS